MPCSDAMEIQPETKECWVLVIDDDDDFREALSELLRDDGLHVRAADQVVDAIRELESTEFDAVLSDLVMPGNGHLVVEYVGAHQPRTPVIVISSQESAPQILAGSTARAFACLLKPVGFEEIRHVLERALVARRDGTG